MNSSVQTVYEYASAGFEAAFSYMIAFSYNLDTTGCEGFGRKLFKYL